MTAIASPRALNEPVGSRPSSLTSKLMAPAFAAVSTSGTIGVSGSPRLTGSAPSGSGSSSRHFHMPGSRASQAFARQRLARPLEIVTDEQGLARCAEIVRLAGGIALTGQRAFEMGHIHGPPVARAVRRCEVVIV